MKVLLLDIETAPNKVYVWGLFQQNIAINQIEEPGYTLSWSAKWLDDKEIMYSDIRDGNEVMLGKIYDLVDEADVVVHYYGSNFDMPTLSREWVVQGWKPPAPYIQIDLCNIVKKRFKFPSNKLDYVARQLKLGHKIPHKGMELWRGCMEDDAASWRTMKSYNKQDVNLLERLYKKLLPWIANHPNRGLWNNSEKFLCPHCGSVHVEKRGYYYTKTMMYQRYRCNDCGAWSKERTTILKKEKRKYILAGVG
jgi:DNA polymerase elongation subunit (family B)/predicted RNA-binding Zn-ribbon protein involved in translation (DUF1610 family)